MFRFCDDCLSFLLLEVLCCILGWNSGVWDISPFRYTTSWGWAAKSIVMLQELVHEGNCLLGTISLHIGSCKLCMLVMVTMPFCWSLSLVTCAATWCWSGRMTCLRRHVECTNKVSSWEPEHAKKYHIAFIIGFWGWQAFHFSQNTVGLGWKFCSQKDGLAVLMAFGFNHRLSSVWSRYNVPELTLQTSAERSGMKSCPTLSKSIQKLWHEFCPILPASAEVWYEVPDLLRLHTNLTYDSYCWWFDVPTSPPASETRFEVWSHCVQARSSYNVICFFSFSR